MPHQAKSGDQDARDEIFLVEYVQLSEAEEFGHSPDIG